MKKRKFRHTLWLIRRFTRNTVTWIRYTIDNSTYEHLRRKALRGGKENADAYWDFYKVYWRKWDGGGR